MTDFLETTVDKFVFRVATDRLFSSDGVWALLQGDRVLVGLSDYVQQRNGDVAFARVKSVGANLVGGDELAEVETVKANVSVFSPVSGTVVEVNSVLELGPEIINDSPYEKGWLAVISASNWENERAKLLTPEAYLAAIQSQAEQELNG
jgi:glycine cleavage system H protein